MYRTCANKPYLGNQKERHSLSMVEGSQNVIEHKSKAQRHKREEHSHFGFIQRQENGGRDAFLSVRIMQPP